MKINETDIGDGDDSEDGVEFDEASLAQLSEGLGCVVLQDVRGIG